jgi:hypothetical protein
MEIVLKLSKMLKIKKVPSDTLETVGYFFYNFKKKMMKNKIKIYMFVLGCILIFPFCNNKTTSFKILSIKKIKNNILNKETCSINTNIDSIIIYYEDWDVITCIAYNCEEFSNYSNNSIRLINYNYFQTIDNYIKSFCEIYKNSPDVRIKLLIYRKNNVISSFCLGNFSFVLDNKIVNYNEDFKNYIIELIEENKK